MDLETRAKVIQIAINLCGDIEDPERLSIETAKRVWDKCGIKYEIAENTVSKAGANG